MSVDVGSTPAVLQFALQLVEGDQTVHYIWSPRKQLRDNTRPSETGADGGRREQTGADGSRGEQRGAEGDGGEVGCWWRAGLGTTGTRQWRVAQPPWPGTIPSSHRGHGDTRTTTALGCQRFTVIFARFGGVESHFLCWKCLLALLHNNLLRQTDS